MKITLFDDIQVNKLLPLTFTRPAGEIRVGILNISDKWGRHLKAEAKSLAHSYKHQKFSGWGKQSDLWINGRLIPNQDIIKMIMLLEEGQGLKSETETILAVKRQGADFSQFNTQVDWKIAEGEFINYPEDIFTRNEVEIANDYLLITNGRHSEKLSESNKVTGTGKIFLEKNARVEGAILNPDGGYIYIGEGAEIMEGSLVRGSLALCDHATLKLGAKVYGATTVGPHCKVGGEVNNSVIFGYSNKGHDGFLGNSVIGEWCNIGADSNNSNLKNNYAEVKIWDFATERFRNTGLQFCGLIMGDHSKCGINTMFNTGTVVGVASNIFGSGFPRNFVPSFAWGGHAGFSTYELNKVFETAKIVMSRRGVDLDEIEQQVLSSVFEETSKSRFWELNKTKVI